MEQARKTRPPMIISSFIPNLSPLSHETKECTENDSKHKNDGKEHLKQKYENSFKLDFGAGHCVRVYCVLFSHSLHYVTTFYCSTEWNMTRAYRRKMAKEQRQTTHTWNNQNSGISANSRIFEKFQLWTRQTTPIDGRRTNERERDGEKRGRERKEKNA